MIKSCIIHYFIFIYYFCEWAKDNKYYNKKTPINKYNGYTYCEVRFKDGKIRHRRLHKIMAEMFIHTVPVEGLNIVGHHDNIKSNYNDCGVMLYDINTQKDVHAGGSGPVCSALVVFSYIFSQMKNKKLKRVLFLATGALFSPILVYQKENINSICHAISLEVV